MYIDESLRNPESALMQGLRASPFTVDIYEAIVESNDLETHHVTRNVSAVQPTHISLANMVTYESDDTIAVPSTAEPITIYINNTIVE